MSLRQYETIITRMYTQIDLVLCPNMLSVVSVAYGESIPKTETETSKSDENLLRYVKSMSILKLFKGFVAFRHFGGRFFTFVKKMLDTHF